MVSVVSGEGGKSDWRQRRSCQFNLEEVANIIMRQCQSTAYRHANLMKTCEVNKKKIKRLVSQEKNK